jgi:hypothetical protein
MGNIVFFRDKPDVFSCSIKIEGASLANSKARLILGFQEKSFLFEGTISPEGLVSVNLPKLLDITESEGTAKLEVIADSTFFEPWTAPFSLKNQKSIVVSEISIGTVLAPSIVVENISNVTEDPEVHVEQNVVSIYREGCSDKNKKYVEETFGRFKKLTKSEKSLVKESLNEYNPSKQVQTWGNSTFEDSSKTYAKYCMKSLQDGLNNL